MADRRAPGAQVPGGVAVEVVAAPGAGGGRHGRPLPALEGAVGVETVAAAPRSGRRHLVATGGCRAPEPPRRRLRGPGGDRDDGHRSGVSLLDRATTGPLAESVYDAEILKRLPDIIVDYERMRAAGVPIVMSSDAGSPRPSRTTSYRLARACSPGWAIPTPTPSAPSPPGRRRRAVSATGKAAWLRVTTPTSSPSPVTHCTTLTRYSRLWRCSAAASASSSASALSLMGGWRFPVRLADR